MYSPEIQAKLTNLRAKASAGNYDLAACREAVRLLREGREATQSTTAKAKAKSKAPVDTDALFRDLDSL